MRINEDERAVTPVIGIILMVALTVILAAVTGVFVLGIADNMNKGVRAGADIMFENNKVKVLYISGGNAEYLNATFSGWGHEGVAQLNTTGATASLGTNGFNVSGYAWKPQDIPNADLPNKGDEVSVVVVGVSGGESTVIVSDTGRI